MRKSCLQSIVLLLAILALPCSVGSADDAAFERTRDVIYGRKHRTALTMDVSTPKEKVNGAAIIWVVSGGWFSSYDALQPQAPFAPINEVIKRGYTVFAVVHGSQPKFTIPEILEHMHRAVRYIRHAVDYKIDPQRIGITGGSAGGHLSLMHRVPRAMLEIRPRNIQSTRPQAECKRSHVSFRRLTS